MTKNPITLEAFARKFNITASIVEVSNPPADRLKEYPKGRHFRVALKREGFGQTETTYYSQGSGIKDAPTVVDILNSFKCDSSGYVCARDFEDYASNYGLDVNSRKEEQKYKNLGRFVRDFKTVLGTPDVFDRLLNGTIDL